MRPGIPFEWQQPHCSSEECMTDLDSATRRPEGTAVAEHVRPIQQASRTRVHSEGIGLAEDILWLGQFSISALRTVFISGGARRKDEYKKGSSPIVGDFCFVAWYVRHRYHRAQGTVVEPLSHMRSLRVQHIWPSASRRPLCLSIQRGNVLYRPGRELGSCA